MIVHWSHSNVSKESNLKLNAKMLIKMLELNLAMKRDTRSFSGFEIARDVIEFQS